MEREKLIFVVDDDRNQFTFFELAIKKAKLPESWFRFFENGFEVKRYFEDALEKEGKIPDGLVVDLKMPLMSGFELIAWLRAHSRCKKAKVVVMSCSDEERDKAEARRLGCDYFVKQPDLNELVKVIENF